MTASSAPYLAVLPDELAFAELVLLLQASGFGRCDDGTADELPLSLWSDGAHRIVLARDAASGVRTLAAPDGLPPALAQQLPAMRLEAAEIRAAGIPYAVTDRQGTLQALRRLAGSPEAVPEPARHLLAMALANRDWEIVATAMLSLARLGIGCFARDIARLGFPEDPVRGIGPHEERVLLALRDASLAMLGQPRDKALPAGLIAAIRGEPGTLPPDIAAFVHSLVTPLPDAIEAPPPGPGIEMTGQGPQTFEGRLLVWIPPMDYWLGHRAQPRGLPNPPRRIRLAQGFFIEAEARPPMTLGEAHEAAQAEASQLDRPVQLASSQEWEMAARGPDGRRYPWGQNADPALRVDLSPYGMADMISGPGEWLADPVPGAQGLVTAGAGSVLLSARRLAPADSRRPARFVYPCPAPIS